MDETESGAVSGVKDVLAPGEEFHGYVVDRQIGAGGLGTIWLARHQMLDTLFAVKVLAPAVAKEQPDSVKPVRRKEKKIEDLSENYKSIHLL